ncbi:hypothetical protein [Bowmanella sp. JS7-9]|uniref:Uncharacterized protein n=1 Tax=Pseudobowmanella zhangzhouensis TaxID=1537679 RepID=A0ABW1XH50_9ALTE|nr:hypothetical protein [Bowmanella sp. JS7-9]TBX21410.1 hypothetical protein TK45_12750 [Bowmanella sp. JS7-9]
MIMWLLGQPLVDSEELAREARLADLHANGHRRQTLGRIKHIAGRADTLALCFAAGAIHGATKSTSNQLTSLLSLARWIV